MSINADEGFRPLKKPSRSKKLPLAIGAVVLALLLAVAGGAYGLSSHYSNRALPGTTIAGKDVSGLTAADIIKQLNEREGKATVTLDVAGRSITSPIRETGVSIDAAKTAEQAVSHNAGMVTTARSFINGKHTVTPVVTVDRKTLEQYAHRAAADTADDPASNARVIYDRDAKRWQAVPGQTGQSLDVDALLTELKKQAPGLAPIKISAPIVETAPKLGDEQAEEAVKNLNLGLSKKMTVVNPHYRVHGINSARRGSWMTVEPNEDATAFVVKVDREKVASWVRDTAASDTRYMESNSMGAPDDPNATVTYKITNTSEVTDKIVAALEKGESMEVDFKVTQTVKRSKPTPSPSATAEKKEEEQKKQEDSDAKATGLPSYAPSGLGAHEKWIDVNLSNKTVTAYEGSKKVWGPVKIVDGGPKYRTVTGTYRIYLRREKQDMTNEAYYPKGHPEYYYTKDVPWIQYFHRGTAFHGAPWRSSFGYSGSHGCINMRVSDAKWLYGWARVGTLVVTHR